MADLSFNRQDRIGANKFSIFDINVAKKILFPFLSDCVFSSYKKKDSQISSSRDVTTLIKIRRNFARAKKYYHLRKRHGGKSTHTNNSGTGGCLKSITLPAITDNAA